MTRIRQFAVANGILLASVLLGPAYAQVQSPTIEELIGLDPAGAQVWQNNAPLVTPNTQARPYVEIAQQRLAANQNAAPVYATPTALAARADVTKQEPVPVPPAEPGVIQSELGPTGGIEGGPNLYADALGICQNCCRTGFIVGAEGTFLAPIGEPDQTVLFTNLVDGTTHFASAEPGFSAGIRTWVGIQCEGWGFRVRYWHQGDNNLHPDPVVPIKGEPSFVEAFYLRANTIDLELTQRLCCGKCRIDYSFGGRYAHLERNSTVYGYGTVGDVNLIGLAMGANEIEGSGFVFSINGRKPIGCCGCWNCFWGYRGSLLWADSTASVLTEANAVTKPPIGAFSANSQDKAFASKDHSENVFISEVQLGVQYERCLCCLPATFFFRLVAEYQHWETGDVTAYSNSFAFLQGAPPAFGGRVDAAADAHDGDLDLIGFTIGAGLTY